MCQSCFTAFRAKVSVAAFRLRPAGAIPAQIGSCDRGTVFSCREYQDLRGDPLCFGRGYPGCTTKTTDECDSGCNLSCHFFKVLLDVQHPV